MERCSCYFSHDHRLVGWQWRLKTFTNIYSRRLSRCCQYLECVILDVTPAAFDELAVLGQAACSISARIAAGLGGGDSCRASRRSCTSQSATRTARRGVTMPPTAVLASARVAMEQCLTARAEDHSGPSWGCRGGARIPLGCLQGCGTASRGRRVSSCCEPRLRAGYAPLSRHSRCRPRWRSVRFARCGRLLRGRPRSNSS
jgi:hypothetical protein